MDYKKMLKDELKDELDNRDIVFSKEAVRAELEDLLLQDDLRNQEMEKYQESASSANPGMTMIRYIGKAGSATRIGDVTEEFYRFEKDEDKVPMATAVYNEDVPALLAEKGNSCCGRAPDILFILDSEYEDVIC